MFVLSNGCRQHVATHIEIGRPFYQWLSFVITSIRLSLSMQDHPMFIIWILRIVVYLFLIMESYDL